MTCTRSLIRVALIAAAAACEESGRPGSNRRRPAWEEETGRFAKSAKVKEKGVILAA
jgi:hypothetical protein